VDAIVFKQTNGKLQLMCGSFEMHFQRKGNSNVKRIYFENHNGKTGHCVPRKYNEPAKKKAIEILCRD